MTVKRVLLIDDEDTIQAVVQFGIKLMTNWQMLTATSGEEGISTAQVAQPDVILLDMMLPDMDGQKTLNRLRSQPETCQIPVIFLTATVHLSEDEPLHDDVVKGVISKPFNAIDLPAQIANLLDWSLLQ